MVSSSSWTCGRGRPVGLEHLIVEAFGLVGRKLHSPVRGPRWCRHPNMVAHCAPGRKTKTLMRAISIIDHAMMEASDDIPGPRTIGSPPRAPPWKSRPQSLSARRRPAGRRTDPRGGTDPGASRQGDRHRHRQDRATSRARWSPRSCSTGTAAVFLHPAEAVHGDLGIYTPGDPTVLISKHGTSRGVAGAGAAAARVPFAADRHTGQRWRRPWLRRWTYCWTHRWSARPTRTTWRRRPAP